jgi:hypothetical protein
VTDIAVAWIGFAGAVIAAAISAVVAVRQATLSQRQVVLESALESERHEREALFDRTLVAADILSRYREPLAGAAYDLQSRIYNILCMDFLGKWWDDPDRVDDAVTTTLFRLAQYFGWTELLRRKIQFLSFPEDDDTRDVSRLQFNIGKSFLTDEYGPGLMIWSDEQRAIGEQMIIEDHGDVLCMGYARFRGLCQATFGDYVDRLQDEIRQPGVETRLRDVQHLLCDLVETLDKGRLRYTQSLDRA